MSDDESDPVGKPIDEVPKREPDGDCNGKRWEKRADETVFVGYCDLDEAWGRDADTGRCSYHHNGDHGAGGAPEGNDNAVTTGAFRDHFTSHLTDAEMEAFNEARELLEDPSGAQEIARTAATICLLQFDRGGDERFMRRFESLCDKFGIAPEDVERHEHTGQDGGPIEVTVKRERYDGE